MEGGGGLGGEKGIYGNFVLCAQLFSKPKTTPKIDTNEKKKRCSMSLV